MKGFAIRFRYEERARFRLQPIMMLCLLSAALAALLAAGCGPAAQDTDASAAQPDDAERLLLECERGNAGSCTFLGRRFTDGAGVAKDEARGAAFIERGCHGGFGRACVNLGLRYENGRAGVPYDKERAMELYRRALPLLEAGCGRGDEWDCAQLGRMLEATYDYGLRPDAGRAAAAYRKACDLGHQESCNHLGKDR